MFQTIKASPLVVLLIKIATAIGAIALIFLFRAQLLTLIAPFFIAFVLAYILNPVVNWMQKKKIPRTLSVCIIYLIVFSLLFFAFYRLVPAVLSEVNRFVSKTPVYIGQAQELVEQFNEATKHLELSESVQEAINDNLDSLERSLITVLTRVPEFTTGLAKTLFNIFLVLILTFYFLKDFDLIKETLFALVPRKRKARVRKIVHEIDESLGNYIRGQLIICTVIGVSTYLGLLILGVDYAMMLGLFAGITNIIPYFGPFIGAIPAIIVALLQSPLLGLKVAVVITVIQQVESQAIAPQVLGKKMGMHPLIVIGSLIAGGQLFGIPGMILAVPVVAVIRILVRNMGTLPRDEIVHSTSVKV